MNREKHECWTEGIPNPHILSTRWYGTLSLQRKRWQKIEGRNRWSSKGKIRNSRKADKSSEITLYIKIMDRDSYIYICILWSAHSSSIWYSDRIHLIIWHRAPFAEPEHLISEVCWKLHVRTLSQVQMPY